MSRIITFPVKPASTPIPALYENLKTRDVLMFVTPLVGHCIGHSAKDSKLNQHGQGDVVVLGKSVLEDPNWRRCATGSSFTYIQD